MKAISFSKEDFVKLVQDLLAKLPFPQKAKKEVTAVREGWPVGSPRTIRIYLTVSIGPLAVGPYTLTKVAFTKEPTYRIPNTSFEMTEEQWGCLADTGFLAVAHSTSA